MSNYQDLIAWQKSMALVEKVYAETRQFPQEELYGISSQLRRAAVSIPSNIAEGEGRGGKKEFLRYLTFAYGALREVETQILICQRLAFLNHQTTLCLLGVCNEIGKLINGLKRKNQSI